MTGRREIAVLNVEGRLYAIYNRCPHAQAPLSFGIVGGTNIPSEVGAVRRGLVGRVLRCPWHHFEFDLETGRCVASPDNLRVATYEVKIEGDEVAVYV